MTQYYHRYHLVTKLYRGSTDDISDPAYGYTQIDFPEVDVDPFERFWIWCDDHWELTTSEQYNLLKDQE